MKKLFGKNIAHLMTMTGRSLVPGPRRSTLAHR